MLLECSNLSKSYGNVKALDKVSFTLEEGISFILGPNGSGKTTFIKIVSNIIKPDSGEIRILGRDYLDLSPGEVGFAFEKTVFPGFVRVEDYLHTVGEVRGTDNSDEIISLFQLEKVRKKRFSELSQGYKRRFLVASAFVGLPKVVFLDEPFSNVDITARKIMMKVFVELSHRINVIVVSHVFTNVERMDSLVLLRNGKVIGNLRGKDLKRMNGFRASFDDGRVVVNDVEAINEKILSGRRLVSIEPLSIESWLMERF
ncbi:ABC transporter [Thermococcus profundus]|uniref:ABC transporter n=1 Tax=Thermococcus profundus TaxID=49899 RepID=A0A2Z2MHJ8_THEPR|nr:ABC transporter ATP-binding protein [Thermococcus profundus]ASJ03414.1 ABC transporter [Thermococcus profundus]